MIEESELICPTSALTMEGHGPGRNVGHVARAVNRSLHDYGCQPESLGLLKAP